MGVANMTSKTMNRETRIEQILDYTLGSTDASELCKRFVHGTFAWGTVHGAYLFHLDNRSNLIQIAGYGMPYIEDAAIFSIWEYSLPALSVRNKQMVTATENSRQIAALPTMLNGIPNGCLLLVLSQDSSVDEDGKKLGTLLSKLGGYFLANQMKQIASNSINRDGPAVRSTVVAAGSPEDLTTRQVQILGLMADGLTNAEIAARVLLSESTVRQETIRIYRALRVNSRIEATAKGRLIGLIPKLGFENPVNSK